MIEHFLDPRGTLLRRDVIAAGFDDTLITRACKDKLIFRIHHGGYCRFDIWEQADRAERHRLRSHVVQRLYGDDVARSHVSALLELGGPDWGIDLSKVHLTNLNGIGERTQSSIVHHRGLTLVDDLTRKNGTWLTAPARTVLDTAALAGRDPAVAVLDWAQSSGHASREQLEHGIERMSRWHDVAGLRYKLRLSNGLSQSLLETRGHLLCRDRGIPMFEPQYEVFHPSGGLAARLDGAWPAYRRWIEFDGFIKYLKLRRPGETIEQCILREKRREDLVRRLTSWQPIRVIWSEIERPVETGDAILEFLLRADAA